MRKENKAQIIESIAAQLKETPNFYVTDVEGLNAEATSKLRRACYEKEIKLVVVKNTLFYKALEMNEVADFQQFESVLKGSTAVMFCETANAPAKLIKDVAGKAEIPALKAAYAEEKTRPSRNLWKRSCPQYFPRKQHGFSVPFPVC